MAAYVRWFRPGGTYFFTVVTAGRARLFEDVSNVDRLRAGLARCRASLPFDVVAAAVLPDHFHIVMTLPDGVDDFSTRMRFIKSNFTDDYLASGGVEHQQSMARVERGDRGVWQPRFWEHLCRDESDVARHVDYTHFNAVKHGLVRCPHDWRHSSFHRWVRDGRCHRDWACICHARGEMPEFSWASEEME